MKKMLKIMIYILIGSIISFREVILVEVLFFDAHIQIKNITPKECVTTVTIYTEERRWLPPAITKKDLIMLKDVVRAAIIKNTIKIRNEYIKPYSSI